jgi:hypothetical protein
LRFAASFLGSKVAVIGRVYAYDAYIASSPQKLGLAACIES